MVKFLEEIFDETSNVLGELREGGESEFEEGIYGDESLESGELSADSLSLRLVEGSAADTALEAIAINDREDDSNKHAEDTVRMKNYRRIALMAKTLIMGYKKGDFQEFGREYLMRALRHMRLWQRINSTLPIFIEDLLNRLSDGTEATRDMVLNLDQQLGPATVLSFDSEAAYWGVLTDDEIDPETPRRKHERYVSSSVSEVSDPDYWLKTRYEVEDERTAEEDYEPSIAPNSPAEVPEEEVPEEEVPAGEEVHEGEEHGEVLLPLEEDLDGVGQHPSNAELEADNEMEDVNNRMMQLYRQMLDGAEEAEIRGEHAHAEWLRQQAEELQW